MKSLSFLTGLRYLAILAIASASSAKPNCSAQVAQTPTAGVQKNEAEGTASFDQTTWSQPPKSKETMQRGLRIGFRISPNLTLKQQHNLSSGNKGAHCSRPEDSEICPS